MDKPPSVLQSATVRVRRAQLVVGMGFLARFTGAFFSAYLINRVGMRLLGANPIVAFLITVPLRGLWVLVALPLLCYGASRVLELRPWPTAIGAAITGEVVTVALDFIYNGGQMGWAPAVARVATLVVGVVLSARAVKWGRDASARVADVARKAAESKQSEYDAFAQEAARLADRVAEREAAAVKPSDPAPGSELAADSKSEPKPPS